ncbi:MAG: TadE family type IV pilus minor pilin [Candidatus Nanopelagicales bacterium]
MTAELAVGIMSVVVVLAMMLGAVGVGIAHVRTQEAARAGARAAARGDSSTNIRSIATKAMPGSRVKISRGGDTVSVQVAIKVSMPFLRGAGVNVVATSVAEEEPL